MTLVFDNELQARELMTRWLLKAVFKVVLATNGQAGSSVSYVVKK